MIPNNWFDLVVFSLAVWRVSSLLVHEDGPHAIFRRMREGCESRGLELFWQLFQCVWCTSVWVSGGMIALWWVSPAIGRVIGVWLTASAISITINGIVRDDDDSIEEQTGSAQS